MKIPEGYKLISAGGNTAWQIDLYDIHSSARGAAGGVVITQIDGASAPRNANNAAYVGVYDGDNIIVCGFQCATTRQALRLADCLDQIDGVLVVTKTKKEDANG